MKIAPDMEYVNELSSLSYTLVVLHSTSLSGRGFGVVAEHRQARRKAPCRVCNEAKILCDAGLDLGPIVQANPLITDSLLAPVARRNGPEHEKPGASNTRHHVI